MINKYKCIHCSVKFTKQISHWLDNYSYSYICQNPNCIYNRVHGFHKNKNTCIYITKYVYKKNNYYITSHRITNSTIVNQYGFCIEDSIDYIGHLFKINKFINLNSTKEVKYIFKKIENILSYT